MSLNIDTSMSLQIENTISVWKPIQLSTSNVYNALYNFQGILPFVNIVIRLVSGFESFRGQINQEFVNMMEKGVFNYQPYDPNNSEFYYRLGIDHFIVGKTICKNWFEICIAINELCNKLYDITSLKGDGSNNNPYEITLIRGIYGKRVRTLTDIDENMNKIYIDTCNTMNFTLLKQYYALYYSEYGDIEHVYTYLSHPLIYPRKYIPSEWYSERFERFQLPHR
jgi:hypothetical protein